MDDFLVLERFGDIEIGLMPISKKLYRQSVGGGLGGDQGYFICSSNGTGIEVLAKVTSYDSGLTLLGLMKPSAESLGIRSGVE